MEDFITARLFYHIVWTTRDRALLIAPEIEPTLYSVMGAKARRLRSRVLAVGGMPDHIHMVAAVSPDIAPDSFIYKLKATTGRMMRQRYRLPFAWQKGYGIVTLGQSDVWAFIRYVEQQKQRHRTRRTVFSLEYSPDTEDGPDMPFGPN
jgi:REP element-mobilizing transposase RayT